MWIHSPIHDMLIRIKNAYMARKEIVQWVIYSNFLVATLDLLQAYNFVKSYRVTEIWPKRFITITLFPVLNPIQDVPVLRLYSKPSRRWYVSYKDIKTVAWGQGIWLLSTNQWLMASHVAKAKKIWGELIAEIY
jgi:small subunit ribosomal protein S8